MMVIFICLCTCHHRAVWATEVSYNMPTNQYNRNLTKLLRTFGLWVSTGVPCLHDRIQAQYAVRWAWHGMKILGKQGRWGGILTSEGHFSLFEWEVIAPFYKNSIFLQCNNHLKPRPKRKELKQQSRIRKGTNRVKRKGKKKESTRPGSWFKFCIVVLFLFFLFCFQTRKKTVIPGPDPIAHREGKKKVVKKKREKPCRIESIWIIWMC